MKYHRLLALAFVACLCSCAAHSTRVVAVTIQPGMTGNDLTAEFGSPVKITHRRGGEDWYYHFGTQQREEHPISTTTVSEAERSYTVGHETTTITQVRFLPIHLSPSGQVTGAIPAGHIVVE